MPEAEIDHNPQQPERVLSLVKDKFVRDAGNEAMMLTVKGPDGNELVTGISVARRSPHALLLAATGPHHHSRLDARRSPVFDQRRPSERRIDEPDALLRYLDERPTLSRAEIERRSDSTINQLQPRLLSLVAPVPAGSEGKEAFDKTQRDRRMFEFTSSGSGRYESYATELFAGTLSREIVERIARNLDGKTIFNLGGGNSKISAELATHGASTDVINIEPYPSDKVLAGEDDYDHLLEANPATADFFETTELPEHSADEVWAVFSVPAYLGTSEEVDHLFENVTRMLKPGGIARISHLGIVGAEPDGARISAIRTQLELAKNKGFLIEYVRMQRGTTLMMTAPTT